MTKTGFKHLIFEFWFCLEFRDSSFEFPKPLVLGGEEGGDDVKSAWPLCPGRHTCYNGHYSGPQSRKVKLIPKKWPQFGLRAATRPHEAGIASNRASATARWIRYRVLYTPPVTPGKLAVPEPRPKPADFGKYEIQNPNFETNYNI